MATIIDVARMANVSSMTVSRVVNGTGYVKEETRSRVQQAMAELQYYPNYSARGLVSNKTQILSLLITDITNPFYTTLARGAEDTANRHGYRMLFGNSDENSKKEKEYVEMLLSSRVDGVLFAPSGDDSFNQLKLLRSKDIAFVVLDRLVEGIGSDLVIGDSLAGTRMLMEHLLELGHQEIACISGPAFISTARDRIRGYKEALKLADLPVNPSYIIETDYKIAGGRQAIERLWQLPNKPTAIFAANNFVAIGAIQSLRAKGLRIPEDIAVVSFDDLGLASELDPFLTVAAQPAYDFGAIAAQLLIDRIQGKIDTQWRSVILPPALIVRRSSQTKL